MFNGILTPRQLEGLRVLLTPSRSSSSMRPRIAVGDSQHRRSLLDCHERHQNGTTHLAPDTARSNSATASDAVAPRRRHSAAFGSQRALKTIEDFHRVRAAHRLFRRRYCDRAKKA